MARMTRSLATLLLTGLVLGVCIPVAPAQPPPPAPAAADGPEVLARGPVHEAFATSVESPAPAEIVPKAPPDPIEELPPDQKPEGDHVQWLPGYWHWDNERSDFIWVSGFWRAAPPGRMWVAGSWHQVQGGYQWVHGFWQPTAVEQPAEVQQASQQIEYLAAPPP